MKTALKLTIIVLALGYAGHIDYENARIEEANQVCQYVPDNQLEQCVANQLEQNGDK